MGVSPPQAARFQSRTWSSERILNSNLVFQVGWSEHILFKSLSVWFRALQYLDMQCVGLHLYSCPAPRKYQGQAFVETREEQKVSGAFEPLVQCVPDAWHNLAFYLPWSYTLIKNNLLPKLIWIYVPLIKNPRLIEKVSVGVRTWTQALIPSPMSPPSCHASYLTTSPTVTQANLADTPAGKSQHPSKRVLPTWLQKTLAGECRGRRRRKLCWWGSSESGGHAADTGPWPGWVAQPQVPPEPWGSAVGRAERVDR